MEIFVKKNNKLINLGEGTMLKRKKNLVLREGTGLTISSTAATTPSTFLSSSPAALNKSGNMAKSAVMPNNQLDGNKTDDGPVMHVNKSEVNNPVTRQAVYKFVKGNPDTGSVAVDDDSKTNNNTNPLTSESVLKEFDEIRKNSVPFSKTELTEFLMSI